MIVAHAIFCTIGFLLILPAGVLLARYGRTTIGPAWFKGHAALQFFIGKHTSYFLIWKLKSSAAGPTIFIGVMLGIAAVGKAGAMHLDDNHKVWL